jgi:hypothetical protein
MRSAASPLAVAKDLGYGLDMDNTSVSGDSTRFESWADKQRRLAREAESIAEARA